MDLEFEQFPIEDLTLFELTFVLVALISTY